MFRMCIRIAQQTIASIQQDASYGSSVFSSLEKWYNVNRRHVLIDHREAIRRKIYELYEEKEHVTAIY